ncbi:hypothetical protein HPULCUR_011115 [Helicostylum pulchrum]|uniref:NAD(+) kinase n=1 Tax=Helicostylum pulchrum TaxID=562976 RepID=A0ABP9YG17_9FUNG
MAAEQSNGWNPAQNTILVITKARDNRLVSFTQQLAEWLIFTERYGKANPFTVYVDAHLKHSTLFDYQSLIQKNVVWETNLRFWTPKLCYEHPELFHLIITLGGDGTILFTSTLFQSHIPPIIPFHLGSLGFLAPFLFTSYREDLEALFDGRLQNTANRMRLSCTVYRYKHDPYCVTKAKRGAQDNTVWTQQSIISNDKTNQTSAESSNLHKWELMETAWMRKAFKQSAKKYVKDESSLDEKITCYSTVPAQTFHVLNEIIVDRGPSSNMSMLELFGDERHLTTVQADGLCIATATGSTAYSLSAGGTLTHPDMQCTLVTPICPHTLSFRPMLLPSSISIRIFVPFGSRHVSYCRFDGRNRIELKQGDHIKITVSPYPVKTYSSCDASNDWFSSVQSCLLWNNRQRQKSFVVVEGDQLKQKKAENMFACIRTEEDNMPNTSNFDEAMDQDDNRQEQQYELNPWSDDELSREEDGFKLESKI